MSTAGTAREPGLRERKKQRTRELIAETARRLFVQRGFAQVTVADVAREAEVAEKTVFNYFPTKEDLVYWRLESFEDELLDAVRARAPEESVLAAFARFVRTQRGWLVATDPEAGERMAAITRMITESPALLARERQVYERYTAALAGLIAEESTADRDDVVPWVAANAMIGAHRGLVDYTRRCIVAGARRPQVAREVRKQADQALALLERGLGGYAVKGGEARAKGAAKPRARARRG